MSKAQLRAVNPEVEHPRDRARREVKRWRSDADKRRLPITTLTGETPLPVDDILQRTLREMPEETRPHYKPNPLIVLLIAIGSMLGILWLVASYLR